MAKTYSFETVVRSEHLDSYGHVNHASYLNLFEDARWALLEEYGQGHKTVLAQKMGPIVTECHLRYRRELRLAEHLKIHSTFRPSLKKHLMVVDQEIIKDDGAVACYAEVTMALMNLDERSLVPINEQWFQIINT